MYPIDVIRLNLFLWCIAHQFQLVWLCQRHEISAVNTKMWLHFSLLVVWLINTFVCVVFSSWVVFSAISYVMILQQKHDTIIDYWLFSTVQREIQWIYNEYHFFGMSFTRVNSLAWSLKNQTNKLRLHIFDSVVGQRHHDRDWWIRKEEWNGIWEGEKKIEIERQQINR